MTVIIWKEHFAIIDNEPAGDVYRTLMYTESEIIDGDPSYFSEQSEDAFKSDDYDETDEIICANFTWTQIDEEDESYKWLIRTALGVKNAR